MLEDQNFQKWWKDSYKNKLGSQPIMEMAFMEVAYKAWLAAYDLGLKTGIDEADYKEHVSFGG